jgi:hypothetical protein
MTKKDSGMEKSSVAEVHEPDKRVIESAKSTSVMVII